MSWSTTKSFWLPASIVINIALIIVCFWFYLTAQSFYTDYRHFRTLGSGTSQSTNTPVTPSIEGQTKIVMFGDSRIEYWLPLPALENAQFINAGVSGETTTEMRRRFEHDVLRHSPDIVVMQSGVNDLTASVTKGIENPQKLIELMHENTQYFIDTLQNNNIQLVITSIFPSAKYSLSKKLFWEKDLSEKIANSNRILEKIVKDSNAQWLDFNPVFYDNKANLRTDRHRDVLHINATAYEALNQQLNERLTTLITR